MLAWDMKKTPPNEDEIIRSSITVTEFFVYKKLKIFHIAKCENKSKIKQIEFQWNPPNPSAHVHQTVTFFNFWIWLSDSQYFGGKQGEFRNPDCAAVNDLFFSRVEECFRVYIRENSHFPQNISDKMVCYALMDTSNVDLLHETLNDSEMMDNSCEFEDLQIRQIAGGNITDFPPIFSQDGE